MCLGDASEGRTTSLGTRGSSPRQKAEGSPTDLRKFSLPIHGCETRVRCWYVAHVMMRSSESEVRLRRETKRKEPALVPRSLDKTIFLSAGLAAVINKKTIKRHSFSPADCFEEQKRPEEEEERIELQYKGRLRRRTPDAREEKRETECGSTGSRYLTTIPRPLLPFPGDDGYILSPTLFQSACSLGANGHYDRSPSF